MSAVLRTAMRRSLTQVRHVSPVAPGAATGLVAAVYEQLERQYGVLAGTVALHSPAPRVLAGCWLMVREALVVTGAADRTTKEAVATAVSMVNSCGYCADLHLTTLDTLNQVREAAGTDRSDSGVADHAVRRVVEWVTAGGTRAGAAGLVAPFPDEQVPELVGVAVTVHYLNRMAHVFLPRSPVPPALPGVAQAGSLRLLGKALGRPARADHRPGESLYLLPTAPLPGDLAWAAADRDIAAAFAGAAAAIDAAGVRSVPERVRSTVLQRVIDWTGEPVDGTTDWAGDALAGLDRAEVPAGRLALLVALAPAQVGGSVVQDVLATGMGERELIELVSWAGFTAARRIGSWMWRPGRLRLVPELRPPD